MPGWYQYQVSVIMVILIILIMITTILIIIIQSIITITILITNKDYNDLICGVPMCNKLTASRVEQTLNVSSNLSRSSPRRLSNDR